MPRDGFGGISAVRIEGLRAARQHMRDIDVGFIETQKEMTLEIAKEVASAARSFAELQGGSLRKGAFSIRASSTERGAGIRFGGPRAPWMKGSEFGSVRYRQFQAWRGNGADAGYAIFPTIRGMRQRIEQLATEFVERLLEIFGDDINAAA